MPSSCYSFVGFLIFQVARICADIIRILVTLTRPLSDYVLAILYRIFMGQTKKLPPIDNKILVLSATELAEKIRKRQLSCEEVMKAYVERSKLVHPYINAAVDERYEDALNDARNVDKFLASGAKSEVDIARDTPLLGIPFSCKEAIGVKGMKQTCGLVRYKDHRPEKDDDAPALYRKAGGIPVTVTNVPELCMWWESACKVYGRTKSPFDVTRTVGGSTGGEGAIITSAGALFGIGNDIAGSIRIPSSFCGIYGHKPSRSVISNMGNFPLDQYKLEKEDRTNDFVSTGPMCRYVQDLPLLFKILSDNDQRLQLQEKVNFRNVKVYYIKEFPGILNSAVPAMKKAIRKAVKHFEEQFGIKASPINFPELKYGFDIWECKLLEYDFPGITYLLKGNDESICLWNELFKNIFGYSDHTLPAIYNGMVDRREKDSYYHFCLDQFEELQRKFNEIFEEDAIVLVPTHPEPPPHYLMTIPMYPNVAYTCIFNILGFPSSQIPAGSSKGLPLGIQAVSAPLKDRLSLAAAVELDKVFGGWVTPCPIDV
ncbi:fatty-acid amide hydrolase 2-B [Caerostris darwini]|uniref:Fatty-acid amide hydrolase 2-B n=1 Tax=Caerostris darwini TaxID=1538125 RepID=A0AAV4V427_9ARAC|nr:fatty-acid amide hydrolase 2-B [Caerostris darwini]